MGSNWCALGWDSGQETAASRALLSPVGVGSAQQLQLLPRVALESGICGVCPPWGLSLWALL